MWATDTWPNSYGNDGWTMFGTATKFYVGHLYPNLEPAVKTREVDGLTLWNNSKLEQWRPIQDIGSSAFPLVKKNNRTSDLNLDCRIDGIVLKLTGRWVLNCFKIGKGPTLVQTRISWTSLTNSTSFRTMQWQPKTTQIKQLHKNVRAFTFTIMATRSKFSTNRT